MTEASSGLISRNITICGKRTSIRLEVQMWQSLKDIAKREECSIHDLCSLVSLSRHKGITLTASIRIFIVMYYKAAATEEGHGNAGHGSFQDMLSRFKSKSTSSKKHKELKDYFGAYMQYTKIPNYAQ